MKTTPHQPHQKGADCFLNVKECKAYAFQSVAWREADFHYVHLRQVYRQTEQNFVEALMDLRQSQADTVAVKDLVRTCQTPLASRKDLQIPEGLLPTVLYSTNRSVDKENEGKITRKYVRDQSFAV